MNGRVAVAHLSDLHLKDRGNVIFSKLNALGSAIKSQSDDCELLFIAVTGDIAFSGLREEYRIATTFFQTLVELIGEQKAIFLFIPGNHDCDFHSESILRPIVLNQIDGQLPTITNDKNDAARTCLLVQSNFFDFVESFTGLGTPDRLYSTILYTLSNKTRLRFQLLNTAWLSTKHEQQGEIRFPPGIASQMSQSAQTSPDDYTITLFHHPYSWFDPSNRRLIQTEVESHSDLVLTGHEHVAEQYRRQTANKAELQYVEGGVLQGDAHSSFNPLRLDFSANTTTFHPFVFHGGSYSCPNSQAPAILTRNHGSKRRTTYSNKHFNTELNDPGRAFKHPRRRELTLRDLFIYPDLRQRTLIPRNSGESSTSSTIHSERVLEFIQARKRILITGPSESGKTALARVLFFDLQELYQLSPVFVESADLAGYTRESLKIAVERALTKQYSAEAVDPYFKLPRDKRILILDNFQEYDFNGKAQARLLEEIRSLFESIIIFADDLFRYQELSNEGQNAPPLFDFDHCELKPMGFKLRHNLIQKWVLLGQEYQITETNAFWEVERRERVINTILDEQLIPPYPLLVLLVLQAGEIDANQPISSGTYGYLNDFLIRRALANVSKQVTDIGTMPSFLGHLAYAYFKVDAEYLSKTEFEKITSHYIDDYGLPHTPGAILSTLTDAQLLTDISAGVKFKYHHYYCYFVARYFSEHLESRQDVSFRDGLRQELRSVANNIYFEPSVNILTFYFYFKKDEELIEYLLANSRKIYAGREPCNFESHIEFINLLYDKKPRRSLPQATPSEQQNELRTRMDAGQQNIQPGSEQRPSKVQYADDLQDYLKINIALKTMQVLGQVLKDSPGQLPAKLKSDIAEECYSIGLRTLRAVLLSAELNLDSFERAIEELIKDRRAEDPTAILPRDAKQVMLRLCLSAGVGVIKRISTAVGHNQLEKTYLEVVARFNNSLSVELIDLAVKMEHFQELEFRRIEGVVQSRLRDNIFGYQIVQELVYSHYSLFPSNREDRQKICGLVGITSENARFLDSRLKSLSPGKRPLKARTKRSKKQKK